MHQDPSITPFVECPNCRKLLELGSTQCPECRELIPVDYAALSAMTNILNTEACSVAKDIAGRDFIMTVVLLVEVIPLCLLDLWVFKTPFLFWLTLVPTLIQLLTAVSWYIRFGRFRVLGDSDYAQARQRVVKSARIWAAIFAVQMGVIVGTLM